MNILFRCDASAEIGAGHVMRCLALAQAASDRGARAAFALAEKTPGLETRLVKEGFKLYSIHAEPGSEGDSEQTRKLAKQLKTNWIVADGYRFDAAFLNALAVPAPSVRRPKLLFLDDCGHASYYWADLILNQNLGASETLYKNRAPNARLLLGTAYTLLRREFTSRIGKWQRHIKPVGKRLLITLGGGDLEHILAKIVKALDAPEAGELELAIVVGSKASKMDQLGPANMASRHAPINMAMRANNMATRMARADLAITAGGSTVWESCFMSLPSMIMLLAPNQDQAGAKLAGLGCAELLGKPGGALFSGLAAKVSALMNDKQRRYNMATRSGLLIDGLGAQRVLNAMEDLTI